MTRKEQVTNYRQTREGAFAGLHLGLVPRAELGEAKVVTVHGPFLWFQTHDQCCQLQTGTCQGCLPSTSTRIKSCAAAAADLQHLLKGVHGRVEMRHSVPQERLEEQVFRWLDSLSSQLTSPIPVSPHT